MDTATETPTAAELDYQEACRAAAFCDRLASQHNDDAARASRAGDQRLCEWHCSIRDQHEAAAARCMR